MAVSAACFMAADARYSPDARHTESCFPMRGSRLPGQGSRRWSTGGGTTRTVARQKSHSTSSPAWRWRTGRREPEQERGVGTVQAGTPARHRARYTGA